MTGLLEAGRITAVNAKTGKPPRKNSFSAISTKSRIDSLRGLNASIRFLSCEPLIEDLDELDLSGIDWVIVGGESGVHARPMKPEWMRSILNQANEQKVAFFFKQWGTWGSDGVKRNKKSNGNAGVI